MSKKIKQLGIALFCACVLYTSALFAIPSPFGVHGYLGTEVHFSWGKSTGLVDGYRIYWSEVAGGPYLHRLCEVNAATLSYTASLNSDWEYHLVCRAYNDVGESGNSNVVVWPTE
jgi:hypothetical protein